MSGRAASEHRFHLPSRVVFDLTGEGPELGLEGLFAEEGRLIRGTPSRPVSTWTLADLHTLRAIARRLGLVPERAVTIVCDNCDGRFDVRPSATLELGPYEDGELDDPDLDAPPEGPDEAVRFEPRTVAQARPLHAALARRGPLRVTRDVVRGMGLVELDGVTDAGRIARRLSSAPDDLYDAVVRGFEDATYPRRLETPHRCPSCGATHWELAPAEREFTAPPGDAPEANDVAREPPPAEPFPDLATFDARARELARGVLAEVGDPDVMLVVSGDPADCDAGGNPLLGSYVAGDDGAGRPPVITLYHRTFEAQHRSDGPYDVDAEIEDTLRHELEHHHHALTGHDPLDDDERAALVDEDVRRVGRSETVRRAVREEVATFRGFLAATWWLWLLLALLLVLTFGS